MPRDSHAAGLPPRRDYPEALAGDFMDKAGVMGRVIDQIGAAMDARRIDVAPHLDADREARVVRMSARIRKALDDTLHLGEFSAADIRGAAEVVVDFPTAWDAYRPWEGTPPALSAYKAAVKELADPSLTVKRLDGLSRWAIDDVGKQLDWAKEILGRFSWASAKPDELKLQFNAALAGATAKLTEAMALKAMVEKALAKMAEAV